MYPYLAFIRELNTGSYKIFKENFCSPNDPDGKDKLGVLLRDVMIRRSHMDRFMDAKLVDLPLPSETTIWLELNDIERAIYEVRYPQLVATWFILMYQTSSDCQGTFHRAHQLDIQAGKA